jgi:hypothetical protein
VKDGILLRIKTVEPRSDYRLRVAWATGEQWDVDFSDDVHEGGGWTELRDEQLFGRARVAYDGCVSEWPEPLRGNGEPRVDIDADGLWVMAVEQGESSQPLMQSARK